MDLGPLEGLVGRWRSEADDYERDGALVRGDAMLWRVASELESVLREWWVEPLSIEAAADEEGISYEAMAKRISRGSVPNAGRPRLFGKRCQKRRMKDLPKKASGLPLPKSSCVGGTTPSWE